MRYKLKTPALPFLNGAAVELDQDNDEETVSVKMLETRGQFKEGEVLDVYRYELEEDK